MCSLKKKTGKLLKADSHLLAWCGAHKTVCEGLALLDWAKWPFCDVSLRFIVAPLFEHLTIKLHVPCSVQESSSLSVQRATLVT